VKLLEALWKQAFQGFIQCVKASTFLELLMLYGGTFTYFCGKHWSGL